MRQRVATAPPPPDDGSAELSEELARLTAIRAALRAQALRAGLPLPPADGDAEAASTVFAKKRPGQANMRQRKKPEH